ncbi:LysM peptidoglycan-binding domain-containing protein [Nesterenkonia lacusekhoensis]|uniref:Cell division protein YceG involved in septum cleavage n=1 Tax=Nesterenkonia lacusekhoensis TaxID=150832 RepID=A0ABS4T211_9MICC|nr:LysM peptidoglycan-binding domain-containing protein [Nesterenkonia lacusekhoensis]MBP2318481.1 cell division protein YceG involved in septum cleavage [Nesterenkonia lacusekhoensis]
MHTTMRLTRRGRLLLFGMPAFALLTALVVGMFFLAGALVNQAQASSSEAPGVSAEEVQVGAGDTLWDVASQVDSDQDIRELIGQIAELNGLESSELQPGQTLYVPVED